MTDRDARQVAQQTASEDYAVREGKPYDVAYLRKLAQLWALREMYRTGADVPTAKQWEATYLHAYADTYARLGAADGSEGEA